MTGPGWARAWLFFFLSFCSVSRGGLVPEWGLGRDSKLGGIVQGRLVGLQDAGRVENKEGVILMLLRRGLAAPVLHLRGRDGNRQCF